MLAQEARSLWFFGDDFDFLLRRSWSLTGPHGLFVPHNEHWSTVPIVLFRLCFAVFGLHHYLPYALLPIGYHLATALLLFLLLRRVGVSPWGALLAVLVALFIGGGAGAENTLWDFQAGFLGSAAFGVLALWFLAGDRAGSRVIAVAALVLALMSSGMGLLMVFWSGTYELLRHGIKSALLTVAVPAVVYLGWYAAYGHGHSGAPPMVFSIAPLVAMKGLGQLWSTASGLPGAGPAVLALLAAAVAVPRTRHRIFALGASGLATVVVGYLLFGFSRSGLGMEAATAGRYVYFGVLFCVPAIAAGFDLVAPWLRPRTWSGPIAWLLFAAVVLSVGMAQAVRFGDRRQDQTGDMRERMVAAAQLITDGDQLLRSQPSPRLNPDVDLGALRRAMDEGALPDVVPDRTAVLNASANLQVDVRDDSLGFGPPAHIEWSGFAQRERAGGAARAVSGCEVRVADVGARLEIPTGSSPAQIRIAVASSEFASLLKSGRSKSEAVRWPSSRDQFVYIGTTAANQTLVVRVPPGQVTVCPG